MKSKCIEQWTVVFRESHSWYPWGGALYRMPEQRGCFPPYSLTGGREVWTGFRMAAKVGQGWKPLINVDGMRLLMWHV